MAADWSLNYKYITLIWLLRLYTCNIQWLWPLDVTSTINGKIGAIYDFRMVFWLLFKQHSLNLRFKISRVINFIQKKKLSPSFADEFNIGFNKHNFTLNNFNKFLQLFFLMAILSDQTRVHTLLRRLIIHFKEIKALITCYNC